MQVHPPSEKDEDLTRLLHTWKLDAPLPPRFQKAVWHRIARFDRGKPVGHWAMFSNWVEAALARPRFALSYVSILFLVGLGTGLWQAHGRLVHDDAESPSRYVQMVDPYLMPRN